MNSTPEPYKHYDIIASDESPYAVESESTRRHTVNQLTERLTRATQAIVDFQLYINSLPADRRAVLHDRLGEIFDPIKEAFQVLGMEWLRGSPGALKGANSNVARVLTGPGRELYCCAGCGAVFNGMPGVNAHQSGRFAAESCRPISRPEAAGNRSANQGKGGIDERK